MKKSTRIKGLILLISICLSICVSFISCDKKDNNTNENNNNDIVELYVYNKEKIEYFDLYHVLDNEEVNWDEFWTYKYKVPKKHYALPHFLLNMFSPMSEKKSSNAFDEKIKGLDDNSLLLLSMRMHCLSLDIIRK